MARKSLAGRKNQTEEERRAIQFQNEAQGPSRSREPEHRYGSPDKSSFRVDQQYDNGQSSDEAKNQPATGRLKRKRNEQDLGTGVDVGAPETSAERDNRIIEILGYNPFDPYAKSTPESVAAREALRRQAQQLGQGFPNLTAKLAQKAPQVENNGKVGTDPLMMMLQNLFARDTNEDSDRDDIVCKSISTIVGQVIELAKKHFANDVEIDGKEYMEDLFLNSKSELIRYIGCLAIGGGNGAKDWEELLTKSETRQALVIGIIGRALKEHVFGDLWFGGTPEQKKTLADMEESERFRDQLDGFARTRDRAEEIQGFAKNEFGQNSPDVVRLAKKLDVMLRPFIYPESTSSLEAELANIVFDAGNLSRLMRSAPDVVYYWPPTFKDEEFEPGRMECLNLNYMITNSPYKQKKYNGVVRAALIDDDQETRARSEAIVRVVCFPGLVAYRRKGGKLAVEEITKEKRHPGYLPPDVGALHRRGTDELTPETGFRSKVICKAVVYLQWGKQRLLAKEAGTSAHIDAVKNANMKKYDDDYDGFKELYEIYEKWQDKTRRRAFQRLRSSCS